MRSHHAAERFRSYKLELSEHHAEDQFTALM